MTSLELIEKEIEIAKKQLAKYPLDKEQSDPNYKYKEADIQYIHNKYYTEQLQILQQIKSELEAWEVVKSRLTIGSFINMKSISKDHTNYRIIEKALEVSKNE